MKPMAWRTSVSQAVEADFPTITKMMTFPWMTLTLVLTTRFLAQMSQLSKYTKLRWSWTITETTKGKRTEKTISRSIW
jgi:hypothetical protein